MSFGLITDVYIVTNTSSVMSKANSTQELKQKSMSTIFLQPRKKKTTKKIFKHIFFPRASVEVENVKSMMSVGVVISGKTLNKKTPSRSHRPLSSHLLLLILLGLHQLLFV